MANLANDIRLAVDSGKTALGMNSAIDSIKSNAAKLVIIASKSGEGVLQDVLHMAKVSNIRTIVFEGTSMELGTVCGKPYSVSVLSIMEQGNSTILDSNEE